MSGRHFNKQSSQTNDNEELSNTTLDDFDAFMGMVGFADETPAHVAEEVDVEVLV